MTYAGTITVLILLGTIPSLLFVMVYRPSKWTWAAVGLLAWPLAMLSIFALALVGQIVDDTTTPLWRAVRLCLAAALCTLTWGWFIGYMRSKPKKESVDQGGAP